MISIDTDYLLETLKQSIRINSILPREEPQAVYFAEKIRELGIEPEWHEVAPGRPNVYASLDLGPSDKFLTLTGHMDTVDIAANWPTDPFDPVLDGDKLHGLGSMDMKAGCVCALAAFKALLETPKLHGMLGRVGLAFTVDEEGYGIGARALLDTEYAKSDAMLLGEPYFGCEIGGDDEELPMGLTGKVLYKLTVTGRMAHAFYPEQGVNAVEDAGKILVNAFVAAGYEHSIANMLFIPMGLFVKAGAPAEFWAAIGKTATDYPNLTWSNFFIVNLLPVTIGNIIGGSLMVGIVYWFIYIRKGMIAAVAGETAVN